MSRAAAVPVPADVPHRNAQRPASAVRSVEKVVIVPADRIAVNARPGNVQVPDLRRSGREQVALDLFGHQQRLAHLFPLDQPVLHAVEGHGELGDSSRLFTRTAWLKSITSTRRSAA